MFRATIKLLVLSEKDFEDEQIKTTTGFYWHLKKPAQIAFSGAELVFIDGQCVKNRFGQIQDGKPGF